MRMEEKEKIGLLVKEQLFTLSFLSFILKLTKSGLEGIVPLCLSHTEDQQLPFCLSDTAEQQLLSPEFKEVLHLYLFLCHGSFTSCWNDFTYPLS